MSKADEARALAAKLAGAGPIDYEVDEGAGGQLVPMGRDLGDIDARPAPAFERGPIQAPAGEDLGEIDDPAGTARALANQTLSLRGIPVGRAPVSFPETMGDNATGEGAAPFETYNRPPPKYEPTKGSAIVDITGGDGSDGSGAAGGGMVIPGGMRPDTVESKLGKRVPLEAQIGYAAGTSAEMKGARERRDADVAYYQHAHDLQLAAMQGAADAGKQHAAIEAQRQQIVQEKMARIEALNAEANKRIEDPWQNRGAFAQLMGGIASGVGAFAAGMLRSDNKAQAIIDNQINREIETQKANNQNAASAAGREQNMLGMHLQLLGDQDKAISATKAGLYQNAMMQLEAYKAEHQGQVSQADYDNLMGSLITKRAQELERISTKEQAEITVKDKFQKPQVVGGGAAVASVPGEYAPLDLEHWKILTIPASDKTGAKAKYVAVPKEAYPELVKRQESINVLISLNKEALMARQKLREAVKNNDPTTAASQRKILQGLRDKRANYESTAEGQGVLRDPEYVRSMEHGVDYLQGALGSDILVHGDQNIQYDSNLLNRMGASSVQAASGEEVRHVKHVRVHGEGKNQRKEIAIGWQPTGHLYEPDSVPPEGKE